MKSTGYKPNRKKSLSIGLLPGEHGTLQKKADEAGVPLNRWARAALGLPPGQQRGRPKAAPPADIINTLASLDTPEDEYEGIDATVIDSDWLRTQLAQLPKRG